MRALTIHQPWAYAIVHGYKDVENRKTPIPRQHIGSRIAIHAGLQLASPDAWDMIEEITRVRPPPAEEIPCGGIVGAVTLAASTRITHTVHCRMRQAHGDGRCECGGGIDSPWATGPYGWLLEDANVVQLTRCRGALGLWTVPPEVMRAVKRQRDRGKARRAEGRS